MNFRGRPIDSEGDLQWLVGNRVQEATDIEYKREVYPTSDEGKRELLRDVAAMANAEGGLLLIGIDEDGEGISIELVGVEKGNHAEPITSSCLATISRRIAGLECFEIDLSSGKQVVAICVSRSTNGPHMVTFKGLNQFWKRHGRQKAPMTVDEIEAHIEANMLAVKSLEDFVSERMRFHEMRLARTRPWLVFLASPVFRKSVSLAIQEGSSARSALNSYGRKPNVAVPVVPSLYGLQGLRETLGGKGADGFLQLHRDGFFEWGQVICSRTYPNIIPARVTKERLESLVALVVEVWAQAGVAPPFFAQVGILKAEGMRLGGNPDFPESGEDWSSDQAWEESAHLILPPLGAADVEQLKVLPRELNDRLWQAFHYEKCGYYPDAR